MRYYLDNKSEFTVGVVLGAYRKQLGLLSRPILDVDRGGLVDYLDHFESFDLGQLGEKGKRGVM